MKGKSKKVKGKRKSIGKRKGTRKGKRQEANAKGKGEK